MCMCGLKAGYPYQDIDHAVEAPFKLVNESEVNVNYNFLFRHCLLPSNMKRSLSNSMLTRFCSVLLQSKFTVRSTAYSSSSDDAVSVFIMLTCNFNLLKLS